MIRGFLNHWASEAFDWATNLKLRPAIGSQLVIYYTYIMWPIGP